MSSRIRKHWINTTSVSDLIILLIRCLKLPRVYCKYVCHRFRLHLKPSFIPPGKIQAGNIAFHHENLEMLTIS